MGGGAGVEALGDSVVADAVGVGDGCAAAVGVAARSAGALVTLGGTAPFAVAGPAPLEPRKDQAPAAPAIMRVTPQTTGLRHKGVTLRGAGAGGGAGVQAARGSLAASTVDARAASESTRGGVYAKSLGTAAGGASTLTNDSDV